MIRTIEAVVDENGRVRLLEDVKLPSARRVFVTILEDRPRPTVSETALAEGWERPEEDRAWTYLQSAP